jgi:glycosyltransferase involved in cell wall biosynthesis
MADLLPKVAIVIPTFNRWPHVGVAIDSVLAQSYPRTECVVVDDASTDGTAWEVQRVYGRRVRLIVQPENREKSAARNTGIRATDAQYVCMLDSDDVLTPNSVEARTRLFLEDPSFSGVAYGLSDWGKSRPNLTPEAFANHDLQGDILHRYVEQPFVYNNDYLLSRENMLKFGMYREDMTNREDVELLIRLAAHLEFRFCGSYVARVRRVDGSAQSNHARYIRQGPRMITHLREDEFVAKRLGDRLEQLERRELVELARAHYKARQFRPFRSLFYHILKRWPWHAVGNPRMVRRFLVSLLQVDVTSYSRRSDPAP